MKRFLSCSLAVWTFFAAFPMAKTAWGDERSGRAQAPSAVPSSAAEPDQALRIFLKTGDKKTYVRGYQWMLLDLNRKLNLVESARRGASRMGAVMTLPAETYVAEIDKFFRGNPSMMQMELGQVIQGIAISLKDWDNGGTSS